MNKIMVLLFSFANIQMVVDEVVRSINEETTEIHLCFYQNKDIPDTLSSLMGVYLGDRIQKDVENTILKEYFRMKEEITQQFIRIAKNHDIVLKNQLFKSYSNNRICRYIKKHEVNYLIVNYFKNEFNSQKVFANIEKEFLDRIAIKKKLFNHHN